MKKVAVLILLMRCFTGSSQELADSSLRRHHHLAGLGISMPLGELASTHYPGIQLHYQWYPHEIGRSLMKRPWRFIAGAAVAVFPGKGEKIVGRNFRYRDYFYFNLSGGLSYQLLPALFTSILAGPGLSINGPTTRAGLGMNWSAGWFASSRLSIGPAVDYRKHTKTNALWTASIRASYSF